MKMFPQRERMVRLAQGGAAECGEFGQRGFTLVELMIALTLSIFLIGAVILTFISGRGASLEAEQLARTQENLRFASDFLVRDIRNAGFRDQLTLSFAQYDEIGRCFAKYGPVAPGRVRFTEDCVSDGDDSQLTIRYAGRGACGLALQSNDELKLIENTYFLSTTGELSCTGTEIRFDADGVLLTPQTSTVVLASGLTDLRFTFLFPDSGPPVNANVCNYRDIEALEDACIGVQIDMSFEGAGEPRAATLTAAFRNVVLERLFSRE